MALTTFNTDVENISALSDQPNDNDGLSADELKALFDKAGVDIKDYINNILIPELNDAIAAAAQGIALQNINGNILSDGTVTSGKLSSDEGAEAVITSVIRNYAITLDKLSQPLQTILDNLQNNVTNLLTAIDTKAATASLADVALSGAYSDLSGKPTIPIVDQSVVANSTNALASFRVQELVNAKANIKHDSTGTEFGVGTAAKYGHLKLSAAVDSSAGAADGTAATPGAVKQAYDLASTKQAQAIARNITFSKDATSRTITCNGVTANNHIVVTPAPASYAQWVDNRMRLSAQGANSVTIVADTAPSANVSINVLILP